MKGYLLLFILSISTYNYSQDNDSLKIVSLFDYALENPSKIDSVLTETKKINKSYLLNDIFSKASSQ